MLPAASGDIAVMKLLLAKGADPKLGSNDGVTPLMAAAGVGRASQYVLTKKEEKQNFEAVKFLVGLGAEDVCGQTALSIGEVDPNLLMGFNERANHPNTAELLRKLGGDIQAHFNVVSLPRTAAKP